MFWLTGITSLLLFAASLNTALRLAIKYVELYGEHHMDDTYVSLFILSFILVTCMTALPWAAVHKKWPLAGGCFVAAVAARLVAQGIEFGSLDYKALPCNARIEAFVMTAPNGTARLAAARARLDRVGVPHTVLYGLGLDVPAVDMILTHVHYWKRLYDNSTEGWLLMMEDDVWPLGGDKFLDNVRRAACQADWADVVWLDTRAAAEYTFYGTVGVGSVATLYRRAALPHITAAMARGAPVYEELAAQGGRALLLDYLLFAVCNRGQLRCAAYPLATELGDYSTWT